MSDESKPNESAVSAASALALPLEDARPEGETLSSSSSSGTGSTGTSGDLRDDGGPVDLEEPKSGWTRWVPLGLAIAIPVAFFFLLPPLSKSGLWDPFELNVADLCRRLGLNLYGAGSLALDSADNSFPHLNDIGRPELPFDSIATGFALFGLHEWAGRAPLALWGVAGVVTTYAFIARMVDRRAGLYSAIALTTTPLYFVQARTMLGDVVSMAAFAMAAGGLTVAVFDRDEKGPTPVKSRALWLVVGLAGLAAGLESRGGVLGVAVPLLGVASAWGVTRISSSSPEKDSFGRFVALLGGIVGIAILVQAIRLFEEDKVPDMSLLLGTTLKTQSKYPTYEYYLGHILHSCAPWSAFVPFAFGRLFLAPAGRSGSLFRRESNLRVALVTIAAVAFVAHGWLAARTDLIPFIAPAILAAACGVAIRDYDRGAAPSLAVGLGTTLLLACTHHDFHELPEKAYQAFGVVQSNFPEGFKDKSLLLWTAALIGFAGFTFLVWGERRASRKPFDPAEYLKILRALRDAWDGLLALAFFALVAGFSLGALAIWIGMRTHGAWLPNLSLQVRDWLLNAWWIVAFVPLGAMFGVFFAFDVFLWTFKHAGPITTKSLTRGFEPFEDLYMRLKGELTSPGASPEEIVSERIVAATILVPFMVLAVPGAVMAGLVATGTTAFIAAAVAVFSGLTTFIGLGIVGDLLKGHRASFASVAGVLAGLVLCFAYYPALANQLSPKEVFESYQHIHKGGEPLGLFGVGGRTAAYYAGGQPMILRDPQSAYNWLIGGDSDGRRFIALKAEDLPKLNSLYREHADPRINLPILDARSSQILLAASKLYPGEKNQNPLEKILPEEAKPEHKLDVDLDGKLQCLGYDLVDDSGHLVNAVVPGRSYRMKTYYKVLDKVTTEWEAFIHIDGYHRRHNGDHKPTDGKYPFSLWLPGDLIVDDYEFKLEPNFGQGNYTVYFGLFVGDTRMKVTSGPSDGDNRINGGPLRVL
jgi:4-amino-4-deoxy-L-arabinose transferase-like glycosyltransferase